MKDGLGKGKTCVGCVYGGAEGRSEKEGPPPFPGGLSVHPGLAPSLFVVSSKLAGRRGNFIALYLAACC